MNKTQERSIFFAILCCCCLTIVVILLISIPAGYYIYETYFVCMGDPPKTPGLLLDWDGHKRYSGLIVKYRCNMENSHEVVQIVDCVSGEWKIVMKKTGLCSPEAMAKGRDPSHQLAVPLICQDDPPHLPGMTRIWDGYSRVIGTAVEYRCQKDPEQDRIIVMVCTEFIWKTTYKKSGTCEDLMQIRRCLGEPFQPAQGIPSDWDNKTRDVGTQVRLFCNDAPQSPVMRTMWCDKDYHWHMFSDTKENCYCGHPIYYPQPIQNNWDGKSLAKDTEVAYWCNTALGKVNFMTIKCSATSSWVVTERGSCSYLVDRPLNFTDGVTYCQHMDSEMTVPKNESDMEYLKSMLKEEKSFDLACNHKAFIGLRENVEKQWLVDTGSSNKKYFSALSAMWSSLDEGREHCAAMQQSAKWLLNNVLCSGGIRYCAVCEVNGSNTNPMKVCSQNTCYLAISSHKGDYAHNKKECANLGGRIATPGSLKIMEDLVKAIKMDPSVESGCQFAYVGLINLKRYYETVNLDEINYGIFVHDRVRSMSRHCVVLHEKNQFTYVDEHCPLNTCFMCSITGPPIGSVMLAHVNKMNVLLREKEISLNLQPRAMASPKCKKGWITDGMGCFLFNNTHVTENEARATCRRHMADLASMTIPVDRQFISHHLIRHYSGTDSLLWYVEITGEIEEDPDTYEKSEVEYDYDTNCTVVHLLPHFGWSFMDCTTEAAFICHD